MRRASRHSQQRSVNYNDLRVIPPLMKAASDHNRAGAWGLPPAARVADAAVVGLLILAVTAAYLRIADDS